MLKCSVIGLGVGEKHAQAYQSHNKTILKSVCDFDKSKLENAKTKFPNCEIYTNDKEIINDNSIDIISIASFDNFHSNQIIKSLNNGKHVMAEKPLCLRPKELIKIIEAKKNNPETKLSSNLVLRTNSRFSKIKKDIKNGKFGEIFYLEGDYYWGRIEKLSGWRAEIDFYSIIHGAAVHMIDLAMWLLNAKPLYVQAMGSNISSKSSSLKFNSFAVVLLEFPNGTIVKLTGNGGCIHPHFHGLKVFGNNLTAIHNLKEAYYLSSSENNENSIKLTEPYPEKNSRVNLINSFIDSIIDNSKKPLVSEEETYNLMSVCFSAEEAMKTGRKVKVRYY
tara:strand:- start:2477 stop:3478 length:1002 start_codon:yes stop_codon:yes gene_type:complete